jgi:hypothetical protein
MTFSALPIPFLVYDFLLDTIQGSGKEHNAEILWKSSLVLRIGNKSTQPHRLYSLLFYYNFPLAIFYFIILENPD